MILKKVLVLLFLIPIIILLLSFDSSAKDKWAVKIADSFIALHPDTIAYTTENKSYKWNYEQGLMMYAFYRLWQETGNQKYFNYIKKNLDYYIEDDGTIKTYRMKDFNIDNISPGRITLLMYEETGDEKYKKAADTLREQLQYQPRNKSNGFWHKKIYPNQMWLDGLYMAQPFYIKYSVMNNNHENLDDAVNQFLIIEKHLKDEKTGLYYHGWDESRQMKWADPETGRSPNFWGRAIGWYMMALVEVLDYLPENHSGREDLLKILKDLSASLLEFRDVKTKLWFQIVDKANKEGNYTEASASSMFIYSFARGANRGYLDKQYFDAAKESFNGLINNLVKIESEKIYLTNVVSVGGLGGDPFRDGSYEYYLSEPKRTNDFKGYGPFLLSAIELEYQTKTVGLDYYFNNEEKDGKQFHYIWEDEQNSGYSELGKLLKRLNANFTSIKEAPTPENLSGLDIYIIVDPDTPAETEDPNYIDAESRKVIVDWVKQGGTLVLMANDSANSEFENLNKLAEEFGIHFDGNSKNHVLNRKFEMGKIDDFPDHPIFEEVKSIYLKELSTITLSKSAKPVLIHNGDVIMASAEFGEGFVFAVGDPWIYNEYYDNRLLPVEYENYKAAKNLFRWLLNRGK